MKTEVSLKTELTDKKISQYLYTGEDIEINDFLTFRQPTLREMAFEMDIDDYQSLVSVFLVNEAVVEINNDVKYSNYEIFCSLIQVDDDFKRSVRNSFNLFFGRSDFAIFDGKMYFGDTFFTKDELIESDYENIVKIMLKFNNAKMPEKKIYATDKARLIDEKMEKNRRIIRERESMVDSLTPLMARVEARHPNAGNLLEKTIYQLRLMISALSACEQYDASIILAPYLKDSKFKHWSEV